MDDWTNGACLGYAILAMEAMDCEKDLIHEVVDMMKAQMDWKTVEEADKHYCNSRY